MEVNNNGAPNNAKIDLGKQHQMDIKTDKKGNDNASEVNDTDKINISKKAQALSESLSNNIQDDQKGSDVSAGVPSLGQYVNKNA